MAARLAEEWFAICGGCEVTILDIGEPLLEVLKQIEIVHMPVLMDHKIFGQTGEAAEIEIPQADIGLISGGIRNEEHLKLALEMRKECKVLIALGTCACSGGIPALANECTTNDLLKKVYHDSKSTENDGTPNQQIPALTDRVYAVSEVVHVDACLPGCPTSPEMVAAALVALLQGKPLPMLPSKSVCDDCPAKRDKKVLSKLKRRLEPAEFTPGAPLNEMRCLMEQGFLCLGPATRGGCGGSEGVPRCIRAYMPCEGCFGPLSDKANPMVDMMTLLSSAGLETRQIPDRAATFNRFAGAGRLRPIVKR
jgi:F420-non-reducing hydrogenase small subunit